MMLATSLAALALETVLTPSGRLAVQRISPLERPLFVFEADLIGSDAAAARDHDALASCFWPAATSLASLLLDTDLTGVCVCDVGCGTGLCSLAAAASGANVVTHRVFGTPSHVARNTTEFWAVAIEILQDELDFVGRPVGCSSCHRARRQRRRLARQQCRWRAQFRGRQRGQWRRQGERGFKQVVAGALLKAGRGRAQLLQVLHAVAFCTSTGAGLAFSA